MNNFSELIDSTFPVFSYAKLNLRLKITGRREIDGYHLLSMINAQINLADEIGVIFTREIGCRVEFEWGDPDLARKIPEDNSISKAYRGFFTRFFSTPPLGMQCFIKKQIPLEAGLGGGSSNAASILKLLGSCFASYIKLSPSELIEELILIGQDIGADVPYFTHGGLCCVNGVGERVTVLGESASHLGQVIVVMPPVGSNTAAMYQLYRERIPIIPKTAINPIEISTDRAAILSLIDNDLANLVFEVNPAVRATNEILQSIPSFRVGMTGSGAALFAIPKEPGEIKEEQFEAFKGRLSEIGAKIYKLQFL